MTGLSLRISSGAKKSKSIMSLPPVVIKDHPIKETENVWMKNFLKSETAGDQLSILKKELDNVKDPVDTNIIKFLVVVFFHSEAKHPVKCFLTRYVTRTRHIQETFVGLLTSEITFNLKDCEYEDVINYKDTVFKIGMCLENFPAGTHAVGALAEQLIPYLIKCLNRCLYSFRDVNTKLTDKNAICSLAHLALNIQLHLITKIALTEPEFDDDYEPVVRRLVNRFYNEFQNILYVLLHDKEVPMDTKSLCGLVLFSVECMMFSSAADAWEKLIRREFPAEKNDEVRLAWYSAIVTAVPIETLQMKLYNEQLAPISVIVPILMDIVERNASEGVLVIGVSRSLLHLSKQLPRVPSTLGLSLTTPLLAFVWPHLDHYMDSVRHLAAALLNAVLHYCAHLRELCNSTPPVHLVPKHLTPEWLALDSALAGLAQLGPLRRGYYAGVRGVVRVLGAAASLRAVASPSRLLAALPHRHLTSTVGGTLDMLLTKHSQESDAAVIHEQWLEPILHFVLTNELEPEVISVLDNLLAKAVNLDQKLSAYILPHIKQACESPDYELKNVLSLLRVTRGCLAQLPDAPAETHELWGGVLPYDILKEAVVDAQDEVRVAGLALVCGGMGGAGRGCTRGELAVLLHYLAHCGREPDAHVAQQARAMLDKFAKRLYDSFRAAKRNNEEDKCQMYRDFDDQLRRQCYSALQPCASHSRRATALQLLQTLEPRPLEHRTWKPVYVDRLLVHLDDSYETNKALALDILQHVPLELLKDGDQSVSLKLEDIVRQAGSLKPIESVSAAYKLQLLRRRLPGHLLQGKHCDVPEAAAFIAIQALLASLRFVNHVLHMPRDCPAYGVLHCIAALLECLEPALIRECHEWRCLIRRTMNCCYNLLELGEQVVNSVAPEGAMPADCHFTDYGNNAGVYLEDDRLVTAQMVLLCAWRTVKEATAVLGLIGARLSERRQQSEVAKHLASVLVSARHRGAIEQAYVAYARVVHSMWRETDRMWKCMPPLWLSEMLTSLGRLTRTADRRSAGLPFLIQALVSTEENAGGPGSALHDVMRELLRLADAGAGAEAGAEADAEAAANRRAHACNILRTLYKDASLDTAVQSYVDEGLRVALTGFRGATWAERNSSTLLLSALMTRVFGVTRTRGVLSARNRMTGRVFYLRYPALYDIMLNELKEASESEEKLLLCPSLYPVLLLLGRLYPSSLEGTESNLKLVSFVPYVVSCARSRVLHARRLAASACVPLIAPDRYVEHVQYLLTLVSDARIERNYCHGLLLQICALLDHKPEGVDGSLLEACMQGTQWIVHQAPMCFPLLHQYVLMLSALITRFPESVRQATLDGIAARLRGAVFTVGGEGVAPGRELCLAACLRLLLARSTSAADAEDLIVRGVQHDIHAVSDAALDCLLGLWGRGRGAGEGDAQPEAEASVAAAPAVAADARTVTDALRPYLLEGLRGRALWRRDARRARLYLEVLVRSGSLEVVSAPPPALADSMLAARYRQRPVPYQLCTLIEHAPEGTPHLYVEALINYMVANMESLSEFEWKYVYWTMSGEGCGARREVVARALGAHASRMLDSAARAERSVAFVIESCVFVPLSLLLRAPAAGTRSLAARATLPLTTQGSMRCLVPSRSAELLLKAVARRRERALPLLIAMAMYNIQPLWNTESPNNSHPEDERRVFDNEIENVYDEEEMWVVACADEVVDLCAREGVDPVTQLTSCLELWKCNFSFDTNVITRVLKGNEDVLNPLVEVFIKRLKRENLDE